jgi:hypothetical protein
MRPGFYFLVPVMPIIILAFTMPGTKQTRSYSVPSPLDTAVNSALHYYDISQALPSVKSILGTTDNSEYCLSPIVRAVLQLVLVYHMRIGELLSITAGDEIIPSSFLVRALKGSTDYTIFIPLSARNRMLLDTFHPSHILFPVTYHTVWRQITNAGCGMRLRWRLNRSVTHSGRYKLAEKLTHLNERSRIGPLLHHKTITSSEYYTGTAPERKRPRRASPPGP